MGYEKFLELGKEEFYTEPWGAKRILHQDIPKVALNDIRDLAKWLTSFGGIIETALRNGKKTRINLPQKARHVR